MRRRTRTYDASYRGPALNLHLTRKVVNGATVRGWIALLQRRPSAVGQEDGAVDVRGLTDGSGSSFP
jgi:hypothetical protein